MLIESNLCALYKRIILSSAQFKRQLPTRIILNKDQEPYVLKKIISRRHTHEHRVLEGYVNWGNIQKFTPLERCL